MNRLQFSYWLVLIFAVGVWVGYAIDRSELVPILFGENDHSSDCRFDAEAYTLPTIHPITGRSINDPLNEVKEWTQPPVTTPDPTSIPKD
jgi:hypothetical protein